MWALISRRRFVTVAALACVFVTAAVAILLAVLWPSQGSTRAQYARIRLGMTEAEVQEAAGRPYDACGPPKLQDFILRLCEEQSPGWYADRDNGRAPSWCWDDDDGMLVVVFDQDTGRCGCKAWVRAP